jgi:hypothetical protein
MDVRPTICGRKLVQDGGVLVIGRSKLQQKCGRQGLSIEAQKSGRSGQFERGDTNHTAWTTLAPGG